MFSTYFTIIKTEYPASAENSVSQILQGVAHDAPSTIPNRSTDGTGRKLLTIFFTFLGYKISCTQTYQHADTTTQRGSCIMILKRSMPWRQEGSFLLSEKARASAEKTSFFIDLMVIKKTLCKHSHANAKEKCECYCQLFHHCIVVLLFSSIFVFAMHPKKGGVSLAAVKVDIIFECCTKN